MTPPPPVTIGVVGAGTMGAGIAQLSAEAGMRTLLHDPVSEARERGLAAIASGLERRRLAQEELAAVLARVTVVSDLADLAACGLVIEAAPERLDLKLDLFGRLAAIVAPDCVLATNTSSLSVTEIAAGVPRPERVVGLHFFNPAPVMRLAELVPGEQSGAEALATARAVGEAMGKRVIDAADIAGFLVNRCNRPFFLESLRLLQERVATVEQIDRIVRLAGGFRMGPFELMDLIGIETNHAVAEGFLRQTYGEPRYRPSPLAARMIAAGRLGRKTGRGWYSYEPGTEHRPPDPEPPAVGGGEGRLVVVSGNTPLAAALQAAAAQAGWEVRTEGDAPWLRIDCEGRSLADGPRAVLLGTGSLHLTDPEAVGFHVLPPFESTKLIELTATPRTRAPALERMQTFVASLGRHVEIVGDTSGLVLGRIVAQLVNEGAFVIGEGNGTPEDIDAGMTLGVNHPRGPVAWSSVIGLDHVVDLLDALQRELGDERYRVAPLLRQRAAIGGTLA